MAFRLDPEIREKSFTEFLDKRSALSFVTNVGVIVLVLISNIYNTTPNKLMAISYFTERRSLNKKRLKGSFNESELEPGFRRVRARSNENENSFEHGLRDEQHNPERTSESTDEDQDEHENEHKNESKHQSDCPNDNLLKPRSPKALEEMQTEGTGRPGSNAVRPAEHQFPPEPVVDAGAAGQRDGAGGGLHRSEGSREAGSPNAQVTFIDFLNFVSNFIMPLLFVHIPMGHRFWKTKNVLYLVIPLFVIGMSISYFFV